MSRNEAETRSQLINPAIQSVGWVWPLVREEISAKRIDIIEGQPVVAKLGRVDYLLQVQVNQGTQPVPVAILEAKSEDHSPGNGLEQAKLYAECERLNVPLVIASNGHLWVSFNRHTGVTSEARPMSEFPSPGELRALYEAALGFSLDDPVARPLITPAKSAGGTPRYYQDAAIRAVLEKIAQCEKTNKPKRALLSLATGAGKTIIAADLLHRLDLAGQLTRALFVCDRLELQTQALGKLSILFGNNAVAVGENSDGANTAENARVHVATFQTLDVDKENGSANFLTKHYPPDYFSHIVIDEAHRSAWGKWSEVLTRNPNAVQIGLTATPRELKITEKSPEAAKDAQITADNLKYFGDPVYEYTMAQAMDDGYLAACEIVKATINIDDTGLTLDQVMALRPIDARTGRAMSRTEIQQLYTANTFEQKIQLPDRVSLMCADLFQQILARDGNPHQKTIVFCASDNHAAAVAAEMGNLYGAWCSANGFPPKPFYAFRCTADGKGNAQLPDFKGSVGSHFIATTVELLTTGVDVPAVRNIGFFRYVTSPIQFSQMVGRGTRIDLPTGKLMFRVYDYTNATRLFGRDFVVPPPRTLGQKGDGPPPPPKPIVEVRGLAVTIDTRGQLVVTTIDGRATPIPLEDYKRRLNDKLHAEAATLAEFRNKWCDRENRHALLYALPGGETAAHLLREIQNQEPYDLYDVLAALGYNASPLSRVMRTGRFVWEERNWLGTMPGKTRDVVTGLANQFALGGTDTLEDKLVFQTPEIVRAGGLQSLRLFGDPQAIVRETKERIFAI